MEDLIIARSRQHDFEVVQNQIVCLRQRFENMQLQMKDDQERQAEEERQRKKAMQDLSNVIDQLHA